MAPKLSLIALLGLLSWQAKPASGQSPELQLLCPVDGLILTPRCDCSPLPGVQAGLVGLTPAGFEVRVNGQLVQPIAGDLPALGLTWRQEGQSWRLTHALGQLLVDPARYTPFFYLLPLQAPLTEVEITARRGAEVLIASANVYYNPDPAPVFSITVDDTADLLAELARRPGRYASLFDHPVLAFARDLHQRYGAVFTFFLFYQGTTYPQFDLSRTPDKFREEWAQNASWLHLGFHARAMLPTIPYAQATATQALDDFNAVRGQVLRFAGPQVWDVLMRSHYWSGNRDCVRAWHWAGIQGVYGAVPGYQSYYLTPAQSAVVNQCDYWWDQAEDLLFTQTDIWIERDFGAPGGAHTTLGSLVPVRLDSLFRQPYASQNVQVFTHESLLFDHAVAWQVRQRLEETVAWLIAHGYQSHFDSETPFFSTLLPPPNNLHLESDVADLLSLSWDHHPRQNPCRYQVYRKDLANPKAAWVEVSEGTSTRFADAWRTGLYLYRVYAVDKEGRRSASSPILRVSFHPVPDFNGDETVDMEDFFALAQHFGQRRGEPAYNPIYDLNSDGEVNWADMADFNRSFAKARRAVKGPAR